SCSTGSRASPLHRRLGPALLVVFVKILDNSGGLGMALFTYHNLAASVVVTGIRSDSATTDDVVVTGTFGGTVAAIYQGSLADISRDSSSPPWFSLTPVFADQTVTAATFYGPDTPRFDPSIPLGDFRAVGSYKYDGNSFDHGMMYV